MILVPMVTAHLDDISLQPGQDEMAEYMDTPGYAEMLVNIGETYTLIDEGIVKGIGGVIDQGDGRGLAWALISSKLSGFDLVSATRIVKRELNKCTLRRVEAVIKCDFPPARRWAEMLGFVCETPQGMVNWFKNGKKAYLYARSAK